MASRRDEIVEAALDLLGSVPVERLTTRAIADRVGVSQPALFRHFASREELLQAVVRHVSERLRNELHRLLDAGAALPDAAGELARILFTIAGDSPGVPALFFHDTARADRNDVHDVLQHLLSVPQAFVTELVRDARRGGRLPRALDADAAGVLFVALLQGTLLRARRTGQRADPRQASRLVAFWWAALRAGEPRAAAGEEASAGGEAPAAEEGLVTLDVRPIIERGEDPLATVLSAVARVRSDGALLVVAPFRPRPLVTLLASRGWRARERESEGEVWSVEFLGPACPDVEDLTELEAPLPLERVLLDTSRLEPGEFALFRVPRRPVHLLARLAERHLAYETATAPDGITLLRIHRQEETR